MRLKSDDGDWVENQAGLCALIGSYFSELFTPREEVDVDADFLEHVAPIISTI